MAPSILINPTLVLRAPCAVPRRTVVTAMVTQSFIMSSRHFNLTKCPGAANDFGHRPLAARASGWQVCRHASGLARRPKRRVIRQPGGSPTRPQAGRLAPLLHDLGHCAQDGCLAALQ